MAGSSRRCAYCSTFVVNPQLATAALKWSVSAFVLISVTFTCVPPNPL
ncbi:hypothetical protein KO481_02895 [Nocardia sp. NEAU-G5]|uniref:Uncharacterized protein n=1 Tax=Nocardia albiluteola TaxID=2842303 RepID=A0ABS6AR23_9NOCA|nr:hypothetical protein [Nocardia albiluteola]MBU3060469.1 hypothetical protein [Nocardia albiluteola]